MTSISINKLGKKFNREWIFRNLSLQLDVGDKLVVLGGNGSGKSTFLQIVSGFITPSEGEVVYKKVGNILSHEDIAPRVSFAAPYLQLIEEFTLGEMIKHAAMFKPFINTLTTNEIIEITELAHARGKFIKQFSSGMKQRLKLGLAILADTDVLLLDEPISNLDKNAVNWYQRMINTYTTVRTVVVCSNAIGDEHFFCDKELNVTNHKPTTKF